MKKLTILLDQELHRRLRFLSLMTEESLQRMAVRLLREELRRHPRNNLPRQIAYTQRMKRR